MARQSEIDALTAKINAMDYTLLAALSFIRRDEHGPQFIDQLKYVVEVAQQHPRPWTPMFLDTMCQYIELAEKAVMQDSPFLFPKSPP